MKHIVFSLFCIYYLFRTHLSKNTVDSLWSKKNRSFCWFFFLSFSFLHFVLVAIRGGLLLLLFSIGIRKHTTAISIALHELICWPIYSVLGVRQMNCSFSVKGTWTKWFIFLHSFFRFNILTEKPQMQMPNANNRMYFNTKYLNEVCFIFGIDCIYYSRFQASQILLNIHVF